MRSRESYLGMVRDTISEFARAEHHYVVYCDCEDPIDVYIEPVLYPSYKIECCRCNKYYRLDVYERGEKLYGVDEEITKEEFDRLDDEKYKTLVYR